MRAGAVVAAYVLAACFSPAFAQVQQPPAMPRTLDGHPDLGGFWSSWFLTQLERFDGVTSFTVTKEEGHRIGTEQLALAAEDGGGVGVDPDSRWSGVDNLLEINGEYRTSRIVEPPDGKLVLTEAGKKLADVWEKRPYAAPDGPEMRFTSERCMSNAGVPPMDVMPNFNMRQIVQTPGVVVLYSEEGLDTRIIPLDRPHMPPGVAGPLGDAVGRWEGDALVVETVGVVIEPNGHLVTRPESRVVERFSLLEPDVLLYQYTVEDPVIYAQPWRAEYVMRRSKLKMFEYACHEADQSLPSMLIAARFADQRAADEEAAKKAADAGKADAGKAAGKQIAKARP